MAVLLFWISLTATELGAASQREHGYGAVFALALGAPTTIARFETNPIKTSYMLLWDEVARARDSGITPVGLQNTMRRILESYFRITGGWSDEDITQTFHGVE